MSTSAFGLRTTIELRDGRGRVVVDPDAIIFVIGERALRLPLTEIESVVRRSRDLWLGTPRGMASVPAQHANPGDLDRVEAALRSAMAAALTPERLAEVAANEAMERRQMGAPIFATIAVAAISVVVFLAAFFAGGADGSIESAVSLGVISRGLIEAHQYYRLVTAGFYHFSLMHIGFNMMALWSLAGLERWLGLRRYLVIYLTSIITGNFALVMVTPAAIGAGASTGVFGLLGALVVVHVMWRGSRNRGMRTSGRGLMIALGVNAVISMLPNVSGAGHFGGFAGGAVAAFLVAPRPKRPGPLPEVITTALAWVLAAATVLALGYGDLYKPLFAPEAVRADAMVAAVAPHNANEVAWAVAIDAKATPDELARAEALAQRAFDDTGDASVEDTLAVLLARRERLDEAIAHERHALAEQPRSMFARTLLRFIESRGAPLGTGVDAAAFTVRARAGELQVEGPALPEGAVLFARSRADLHVIVLDASEVPVAEVVPALGLSASSTVTLMWVAAGPPLDGEVTRTLALRGR